MSVSLTSSMTAFDARSVEQMTLGKVRWHAEATADTGSASSQFQCVELIGEFFTTLQQASVLNADVLEPTDLPVVSHNLLVWLVSCAC